MNDRHPVLVEILLWVRDELLGEGEAGIGSFIISPEEWGMEKMGKLLGVVPSYSK